MEGVVQALSAIDTTGRQVMQTPEDVAQMLRLKAAGLAIKSIACKTGRARRLFRYFASLTSAERLNDSEMNSTKARTRVDI